MTKAQFDDLLAAREDLCLTVYMPVVPHIRENATRLKFLLGEGVRQIRSRQRRVSVELVDWERRLSELPDQIMWNSGSRTLCVFAGWSRLEWYFVPLALMEEVSVGRQFRLGPLVALFEFDEPFYVLELRQDQPRLYRCSMQEFEQIELPRIQTVRVARPAELTRGAGVEAEPDSFVLAEPAKYWRQAARAAQGLVRPADAVVVPAGADELVDAFRQAGSFLNLSGEHVRLSYGEARSGRLHREALEVMKRRRHQEITKLKEEFAALDSHQERASQAVVEVFEAAGRGRVRELMFAYGTGVRESEVFREQLTLGSEEPLIDVHDDLIESVIRETLRNGGRVHMLPQAEMPAPSRVAAIFRY